MLDPGSFFTSEIIQKVVVGHDQFGNVRTQLKNLMDARRPLYVEVAKLTVNTDGRGPEDIADEILEHLG